MRQDGRGKGSHGGKGSHRRERTFALLVLLTTLLSAGGCASEPTSPSQPGLPEVAALTELHVSYATRPTNVPSIIALEKKLFEDAFAADGITVVWHELAGTEITEALAAGSIDIATSLNYLSGLMSKAAGNDIKFISGFATFPQAIALVATKDSGVTSPAGLAGKKIALPQGTMLHEMLLKVLAQENVPVGEVEILSMESTDALTALLAGQIEATILPELLLSKAKASEDIVEVCTAEGFISGRTVIGARSDFLAQYPAVAEKFLRTHQECLDYAAANQDEVMALCAQALEIPLPAVQKLYPKFSFDPTLDEAAWADMETSVRFLKESGLLNADTDAESLLASLKP